MLYGIWQIPGTVWSPGLSCDWAPCVHFARKEPKSQALPAPHGKQHCSSSELEATSLSCLPDISHTMSFCTGKWYTGMVGLAQQLSAHSCSTLCAPQITLWFPLIIIAVFSLKLLVWKHKVFIYRLSLQTTCLSMDRIASSVHPVILLQQWNTSSSWSWLLQERP